MNPAFDSARSLLQQQSPCLCCCRAMGFVPQNGICKETATSTPEIPLEKEGTTVRWSLKGSSEMHKPTYKMPKSILFGRWMQLKQSILFLSSLHTARQNCVSREEQQQSVSLQGIQGAELRSQQLCGEMHYLPSGFLKHVNQN